MKKLDCTSPSWMIDTFLAHKCKSQVVGMPISHNLLNDRLDNTSSNSFASFSDSKPHSLFTSHRDNKFNHHLNTVTGHHHLGLLILVIHNGSYFASNISGPHVELRPVTGKEGRVPATLFLLQDIHNCRKLGVRGNGSWLRQNHPSLNISLLNTPKQQPHIVPSQSLVQNLLKHLHPSHSGVPSFLQTNNVNRLSNLNGTPLNTASSHGSTSSDCKHILNGQQKGKFSLALRDGNVVIHSFHELVNLINPLVFPALDGRVGHQSFQSQQCRTRNNGNIITRELVRRKKLANLQFYQLQKLLIINLVLLVEEDHNVGDTHLFGQKDVFFGLRHWAVGAGDDEDGSVHLGGAGDHVLDVVGVAGAVDVSVVTVLGLVLDGGSVDGDASGTLLGGSIDFVVFLGGAVAEGGERHGEGGGEGGLAVVDMTDGTDVDVGLLALELAAGSANCEGAAAKGGGGGGEVEDRGGLDEGGGKVGGGGCVGFEEEGIGGG